MSSLAERQRANVQLVREALGAFERRDFEALRPMIGNDGHITSDAMGVNTGTYHGYDGFMHWTEAWLEAWEEFQIDVLSLDAVGERHVVGHTHQVARGMGSGVPVELRVAYMWEVRDGRIVRMHLYPELEAALAEARRGEGEAEQ